MAIAARAATVVVGAATIVLGGTSCTRVVDEARVVAAQDMGKAPASASDCTSVDAPMTSIPSHTDEEPVMKIPQPEGWERVTVMDSQMIRFSMRNEAMAKDGIAPTAMVTLESHPGFTEPREVFDAEQEALKSDGGVEDMTARQATLCELPAETIVYTSPQKGVMPPHPETMLTAVMHTESDTYAMTLTVQSTDPGNPDYQRDAETILTGFQMLPPSDA